MATVIDDQGQSRFRFGEEGDEAELVYRVVGSRLILVHTEVPESFRGRGIGGKLVRAAVDKASESREAIVPLCPFARKWLEDHVNVAGTVSVDWNET